MLTDYQIAEFTRRARLAGLTDDQIRQEIERKAREMGGFTSPVALSQPQTSGVMTASTATTPTFSSTSKKQTFDTTTTPSSGSGVGSFVVNFVKGLIEPVVEYGKFVGEAAYQAGRFAFSPEFRKSVLGEKLSEEELEKLSKQKATLFYSEEEAQRKLGSREKIAETGLKATAGAESYLVPFGRGTSLMSKVFIPGAVTGALSEASKEEATPESVAESAVFGAGTAGILHGIGKAFSSVFGRGTERGMDIAEKTYAQAFNVPRATAQKIGVKPVEVSRKMLDYGIKGSSNKILESADTVLKSLTKAVHKVVGETDKAVKFSDELTSIGKQIDRMGGISASAKKSLKITLNNFFEGKEQIVPGGLRAADALDVIRELQQEGMKAYLAGKRTGDLATQQVAEAFFGLAEGLSDKLNRAVGKQSVKKAITSELTEKIRSVSPKLADELSKVKTVSDLRSIQKPFVDVAKLIAISEDAASAGSQQTITRAVGALGGGAIGGTLGAAVGAIFGPAVQSVLEASRPSVMTNVATAFRALGASTVKKLGLKFGETISLPQIERIAAMTPAILRERGLTDEEIQQVEDFKKSITPTLETPQQQTIQPLVEKPSPLNPFGGLSKRQVLALALSSGASARDLDEIGKIYDMLAPEDSTAVNEENMKIVDSLRTEYFKRSQENNWVNILNAYEKIVNTSATPAGDISLVYAFMKLIDPTSAVLQGEYANLQNAAGVPEQIRQQYNRLLKGRRLSEKQRIAYKSEARRVFQVYQQRQANIDAYYQGLARRYGVDPSLLGVGLYQENITLSNE